MDGNNSGNQFSRMPVLPSIDASIEEAFGTVDGNAWNLRGQQEQEPQEQQVAATDIIEDYTYNDKEQGEEEEEVEEEVDVFSSNVIPHNADDPKNADSLIASQMARLSVADREQVYMDVHGIANKVTETPELIENSLLQLQKEIEAISNKDAYLLAEAKDESYVHGDDFRLMFLRCEKFHCPKAALRIVRHFQMKLSLFGEDLLALDITQDDLDADAMDVLYGSSARFLDAFDSAGRVINFLLAVRKEYKVDAVVCFIDCLLACLFACLSFFLV